MKLLFVWLIATKANYTTSMGLWYFLNCNTPHLFNLNTTLLEMGLWHKCYMLFVMFWCLTDPCANNSHKKHFTLYCLFLVVNRHLRPTSVLVTLLSWLTKIFLRCWGVFCLFFFLFRQEVKCTKQRFCFPSYKTLEGTTTYATKYLELCCL